MSFRFPLSPLVPMSFRFLSLLLLLTATLPAYAQESYFEFLDPNGLNPSEGDFLYFVDVDKDGELDLYGGGSRGAIGTPFPSTYAAKSGPEELIVPDRGRPYWQRTFRSNALPVPMHSSSGAVTDLNGDNTADFLVSGRGLEEQLFVAVLGDAAKASAIGETWYTKPGLMESTLAGGDLNRDGRLDFLHTGLTSDDENGVRRTELLLRDASGFIPRTVPVPDFAFGDAIWGDIDGDDDEDLIAMGELAGGTLFASAYLNTDGLLVETALGAVEPLAFPDMELGDFDADGDLDLAVTGGALDPVGLRGRLLIYANEGGTFQPIYDDRTAELEGAVRWGDYDNDGDLDLIITGRTTSLRGASTRILQQTATGWEAPDNVSIPAVGRSAATWGDYDADGDLDLAYAGRISAEVLAVGSQRNDSAPANAAPTPPDGLTMEVVDEITVRLSWNAATDDHTPSSGLSYNVRVGRVTDTDTVSPLADPVTGRRYVVGRGNAGQDESYTLSELGPGTYTWSVQAIDGAYVGSPFAPEQTFTVGP